MQGGVLNGRRVLLLEDEMLVSLLIEDVLDSQDCIIVGPFSQVAEAVLAAQTEAIDAAILDMNIGGVMSFPVAEALQARKIPFFFLSGYGQIAMPGDHPEWRVYSKPFTNAELVKALSDRIGGLAP
jgi:DNA-binding NarL/FixJ family response regulator